MCVCLSVCLSVKSNLTSGASVRPENTVTYSVSMLVLPHAVTAGASLYIEQDYLIAGKPE